MPKKNEEVVIPKEKAVFWMDRHGYWYNKFGKFEHKKIIDYFHASIRRDDQGYFLSQMMDGVQEKVYFPYEDTALFVFNIIRNADIVLVLNTRRQVKLRPTKLSIADDQLYMQLARERIKFSEQSLFKISDLIEEENEQYFFRTKKRRYRIGKQRERL
jgi:hypothetical protein